MPACYIHNDQHFPMEALEVHHKHPTAYHGPDTAENRCLLCASCHDVVHRTAQKLYSRKAGEASNILDLYLPNQPARQERLRKLANIIVRARTQHVRDCRIPDAGTDQDDDADTVKMSLDIPAGLHHRLKTLAGKRGLYRYVLKVLERHAIVATQKPGATPAELFAASPPTQSVAKPAVKHDFTLT